MDDDNKVISIRLKCHYCFNLQKHEDLFRIKIIHEQKTIMVCKECEKYFQVKKTIIDSIKDFFLKKPK